MRNSLLRLLEKRGKPTVFVKYVLSYLLILLIPIAFGAAHYERTQQVLTDDATELNLQILQMSQDIVDRLFLESDDVVSALAVDNDVIRLLQSPQKPPTPEQLYNYSLLRNSLNRYVITNKLFQDIFIWFQESGSVVTSRTAYDLTNNNVSIEGKPLAEWLQEVSSTDGKKQVFNLNDVKLEGRDYSLIAYVSPLPNGVQGKARGSIVVFIDQKDITSLFQRLVKKGGYAYIADRQGQLIAPTLSPEQLKAEGKLPAFFDGKAGAAFQQLGGRAMLVSHSRSVQNGWTYVSALPSSVVLAKAEAIKRTIMLFAALTLGGGGLAALYLAYRNSRPFAELLSSWTELHSRIEHQLPLLRETVTERLLRGYYKQEEEAKEAVAEARIPLNGEGYFAASVIVYKDELAAPLTQDPQELSSFLTDRIAFLFGGMDVMMNTEGNKADMIVSFPEADRERLPELLRQRWEEQQDQLQEKNGMRLIVGLGRTTSQLHELWRSHREARQALEYYIPSEQGAVIRYEDRATDSSHYYYPLDVELKLIQTVKHGDLEELERMLQHIQEVNYSERRLNGATRRQLNQELQGTLAKLLEQMEAGSEAFAEWKEKLPVAATAEVETFDWEGWKESLRLLCSHIACHKKDKHNRTAEAMLEMTAQQFADPNFSLAGMAGHFKLSESFISVLFKDYAGETFSEYLERLRLTRACTLLKESDKSIIQIAQETGYNSDKTFRRAFKRVYGVQPTAYRESSQT